VSTVLLVVRCKNRAPSLQPPHSRVLPPPPSGADWSSELRPPPPPFEVCCQVLCTPTRACSCWLVLARACSCRLVLALRFSLSLSLSVTGMGRLEEACVCVCHGNGGGAGMFVYAGVNDGTSPPLALTPSLTRSLGEFAQDVTEHSHGSRGCGSSSGGTGISTVSMCVRERCVCVSVCLRARVCGCV
jgi:hypothetical protein